MAIDPYEANIAGTSESSFQIDTTNDGHKIKFADDRLKVMDKDEAVLKELEVLAGTTNNSAITFKQLKVSKSFHLIAAQADCSTALPTNTGTKRLLVVTTAGNGAAIGDLLYDDGSGSGSMEILSATARVIHIQVALTGGTISFDPDSLYIWDEDGGSWVKVGDIGNVSGSIRSIKIDTDTTQTKTSTTKIPTGAIIHRSEFIGSGYPGSVEINLGTATDDDKFGVFKAFKTNLQLKHQMTSQASEEAFQAKFPAGAPATGTGTAIVYFSVPNG